MKYGVLLFLLSILPAVLSLGENGIMRIPLTYVLDWDFINKLPVRVSFDHSNVFSTSPTSKLNLLKFSSRMLKVLNSQLLALLLWTAPIQTLTNAHKQNMLPALLKEITVYESKYEQEHERARVILGINSLLLLPEKPADILAKVPELFRANLKLVRKNADERLEYDPTSGNILEDDGEEEEDPEEIEFDDEDDEFWEEQFDDNYDSALDLIDEIADFKQTIERLSQEQNAFYKELVQAVPAEDLAALDDKIQKALEKVEKLADKK